MLAPATKEFDRFLVLFDRLASETDISKKLRIMESNDAARAMFGTLLENCIFYISPMYEFLHSQGQERTSPVHLAMSALPPKADK